MALRIGGDLAGGSSCLQCANIETARRVGHAVIEQDQTEQENEAAERQINRDFPRRGDAISAAPNSDEQKCRNQREFVKGVKEEEIDRRESAERAAGNRRRQA